MEGEGATSYSGEYGKAARWPARRWSFEFRLGLVSAKLRQLQADRIVLDIGSADGDYAAELARLSTRCIACDIDAARLHDARRSHPGIRVVRTGVPMLAVRGGTVDAVLAMNSFRYFRQPEAALREFRRVLKPDGLLLIICHNGLCPDILVTARRDAKYVTPWTLGRQVERNGFRVLDTKNYIVPPPKLSARMIPFFTGASASTVVNTISPFFPEFILTAKKETSSAPRGSA